MPKPPKNPPTTEPQPVGCKGFNFHVFTMGASRCTMCGAPR